MQEATELHSANSASLGFPDGFDGMYYVIKTTRDKLDIERLHNSFSVEPANGEERALREGFGYAVIIPARDPNAKYHVHLSWHIDGDSVELTVSYQLDLNDFDTTEDGEPYAEDVMPWLSQFFKYDSAEGHIHSLFTYPLTKRQSLFPIPMKIGAAGEAEINGISLRLPLKPNGVLGLRLMLIQKDDSGTWEVETIAERRVVFKSFDPYEDARTIANTIGDVLTERVP